MCFSIISLVTKPFPPVHPSGALFRVYCKEDKHGYIFSSNKHEDSQTARICRPTCSADALALHGALDGDESHEQDLTASSQMSSWSTLAYISDIFVLSSGSFIDDCRIWYMGVRPVPPAIMRR